MSVSIDFNGKKWTALILLALFLVLQYDLWIGDGSLPSAWRLQQAIDAQRQENAQSAERNAALEAEVQDLKQGLEAIDERARSELGMIGERETFFHVIDK